MQQIQGPELYIGLVAPVGTDLDLVEAALSRQLETVGYSETRIRLIDCVKEFEDWLPSPSSIDVNYTERMNAGNRFRHRIERNDALARLAIVAIQERRAQHWEHEAGTAFKPVPRQAYTIHSLKTPEEVELLRDIYGASFFVVGAYSPIEQRRQSLALRIAASQKDPEVDRYRSIADELIRRDEHERSPWGQNVREAFPLADIFVNAGSKKRAEADVERFVEIVFGHPERTPRKDEMAMFHAFGAKLRSSSEGRQVGAAITTADGSCVALGTNEVAKASGGQYWEGDAHDHRDFNHADSSRQMREAILHDLLARLKKRGWLESEKRARGLPELLEEAEKELLSAMGEDLSEGDPTTLGERALVSRLIEFMRPVHAEMAVLTDCARRGVSTQNGTLYVTTFPCHECARHIVAAGIKRIVFVEPYPKSRTSSMYSDSIAIDGSGDENHIACEAFIGIAPRRFVELFEYQEPRGENRNAEVIRMEKGRWVDWNEVRGEREPRRVELPITVITREKDILAQFNNLLKDKYSFAERQREEHE